MNNKIFYVLIILLLIGITLIFVFSTGYWFLDFVLAGILVLGVYLINKNIKTVYDVIYNKIKEDRDRAITDKFINEFQKYFKGPTDENDKESDNYILEQMRNFKKFENITNDYLNNLNNKLSIEEYFEKILPLFNYTKDNKDELKKNIIKYVVLSYFPEYNTSGVVKPINYKKLVYFYIKDNTDINNEMIENRTKYYVDNVLETVKVFKPELKLDKNDQIIIKNLLARTELRIAYSTLKTNNEKEIFIKYINELLGNYNKKVSITDFIANKITAKVAPELPSTGAADNENLDPNIYNQIAKYKYDALRDNFVAKFNEYLKDHTDNNINEYLPEDDIIFKRIENKNNFLSQTKDYLNNNELSIEDYFKQILPLFNYTENNKDELKKNIIKYAVFFYLDTYIKQNGAIPPPNYKKLADLYIKDKIRTIVDDLLKKERNANSEFETVKNSKIIIGNLFVQKELRIAYSKLKTNDEKEILIDYINELLGNYNKKVSITDYIANKITAKVAPDSPSTGAAYLYIKDKIKNDVDNLLSGQRKYWNKPNYTNLEAMDIYATNELNKMYNDYLTDYEKEILIAYIKELLKDVKDEDDVEKKITKIREFISHNHPMRN